MKVESSFDQLGILQIPPSATLAINEKSKQLISEGRQIVQFGFGQSPFPVPHKMVKALQQNAHRKEYLPVQGLPRLRESIARYYNQEYNLNFKADDIMVGPGSKELIFLIQKAVKTGLLLPSPSWVSYAPQAQICDKPVGWIPTFEEDRWVLTADSLENACKANPQHKLLIVNYPSNPTGGSLGEGWAPQLAEIARRYGLLVISDEIYCPLQFDTIADSLARWYPEGTIVTGGLSKWCGAGGWRLGVAAFPKSLNELLPAVKGLASETFTSVSAPIQFAAIESYNFPDEIKQYLNDSRIILKAVASFVHQKLTSCGITMPTASGGFYLFPNFSSFKQNLSDMGITSSIQLCNLILDETGVALLPGSDFGRPSNELTARLAFVDFDGKYALRWLSSHRDETNWQEEFIKKCCPRIIVGVEKLTRWLSNCSS